MSGRHGRREHVLSSPVCYRSRGRREGTGGFGIHRGGLDRRRARRLFHRAYSKGSGCLLIELSSCVCQVFGRMQGLPAGVEAAHGGRIHGCMLFACSCRRRRQTANKVRSCAQAGWLRGISLPFTRYRVWMAVKVIAWARFTVHPDISIYQLAGFHVGGVQYMDDVWKRAAVRRDGIQSGSAKMAQIKIAGQS